MTPPISLDGALAIASLGAMAVYAVIAALRLDKEEARQEAEARRRHAANQARYHAEIQEAGRRLMAEDSRRATAESLKRNPLPSGGQTVTYKGYFGQAMTEANK